MPGRSRHSGRVVIMDDIAWSEPVPRPRRASAALDPPSWVTPDGPEPSVGDRDRDKRRPVERPMRDHRPAGSRSEAGRHDGRRYEARRPAVGGFRAEDYLEQRSGSELPYRGNALPAREPEVIEYTDAVDDEEIWGPRPKLVATETGGRRTVVITGRGDDRAAATRASSRDEHPVRARYGLQADRTAMWAVLLCVIVLFAAIATH